MEQAFFPNTVHRELVIRSASLLVGKDQSKTQKRIKLSITMPLSGKSLVGMPSWLGDAYTFVAKSHDPVSPQHSLTGVDLLLSAQDLFKNQIAVTKAEIKKFFVTTSGESENPDVDLQFSLYANFSNELWKYAGQMGGILGWAKFEQASFASTASASDDDGEEEAAEAAPAPKEEEDLFRKDKTFMGKEHDATFASKPQTKSKNRKPAVQ